MGAAKKHRKNTDISHLPATRPSIYMCRRKNHNRQRGVFHRMTMGGWVGGGGGGEGVFSQQNALARSFRAERIRRKKDNSDFLP